jgi:Protein of unknown function (DUF1552)
MTKLSRRTFLRGAGAAVALPFLESVVHADGTTDARPPLRMGIFTVTGGTVLESWRPTEAGRLARLPSILRPLEAHKDDMLVLSGLSHSGRSDGGLNAHEHCALMHLTAAESVRKVNGRMLAGVSVDQAAARLVGDRTYLPSLEFGLCNQETRFSFLAPDVPIPYEGNPRLVYERMFRGRTPTVPNWRRRAALAAEQVRNTAQADSPDRSVVDLVREQAGDLSRTLSGGDRRRLDEYLHGIRAIERRIEFIEARQRIEALDAEAPGPSQLHPTPGIPAANIPIWQITRPVHRDPEYHAQYIRLVTDLMVLAFQTDSTRVATLAVGDDDAHFPGVVTVGYETHCHTLEHNGNSGRIENADPIAREALRQIHAWYTGLFGEFIAKLKSIDEGGSSLLDNSMILYTSYMSNGGHGTHDYPILLAGKAGGSLRPGRHLAYRQNTPVANLYVEMLSRMGPQVSRFGNSHNSAHAAYDGRLPDLS